MAMSPVKVRLDNKEVWESGDGYGQYDHPQSGLKFFYTGDYFAILTVYLSGDLVGALGELRYIGLKDRVNIERGFVPAIEVGQEPTRLYYRVEAERI